MSKAFMAIGIIVLGLITFGMVNVIQEYSTGNELDYYLLKETTKGAMEDAIDLSYYRLHGVIRMDKEKFVDSFTRRFANNVTRTKDYEISFYDINETPPKVSVKVHTKTISSFKGNNEAEGSLGIENRLDAIIESVYDSNRIIDNICSEKNKGSNFDGYNICDYNTVTNEKYYLTIN